LQLRPPPKSPLFPYTTLFRSSNRTHSDVMIIVARRTPLGPLLRGVSGQRPLMLVFHSQIGSTLIGCSGFCCAVMIEVYRRGGCRDRKSTRLNSSHDQISYAVF